MSGRMEAFCSIALPYKKDSEKNGGTVHRLNSSNMGLDFLYYEFSNFFYSTEFKIEDMDAILQSSLSKQARRRTTSF